PPNNRRYAMKHRLRLFALPVLGALLALTLAGRATAVSDNGVANRLGFVPITDAPQTCSATSIKWSSSVTDATTVMKKGDAAAPTRNAFASQTTVPGDNDMIAFSPDGRFLFTVAETPTNGAVTKLDLQTGDKTILSQRADWNRLDPIKWYAPSGMLLIGEEDGNNGSMWQGHPGTGAGTKPLGLGAQRHVGGRGRACGRDVRRG